MTNRGRDAKARDRRRRADVALRSRSARAGLEVPPPPAPAKVEANASEIPTSAVPEAFPRASRPAASPAVGRMRRRVGREAKPKARGVGDLVEHLRGLVTDREAATIAVDREVARLRRLGAPWPDIAAALGVSRQAARQKYNRRGLS